MGTQPQPAPVKLAAASVTFHTNDDKKDFDTHVTITVRDSNGSVAARISDDFGEFKDHSDSGPFELLIENASSFELLQAGNVELRIDPVGDDRWRFNFVVDLRFTDGSHLTSSAEGHDMDQDRKQQVFGIV